jgi:hypothetical protein
MVYAKTYLEKKGVHQTKDKKISKHCTTPKHRKTAPKHQDTGVFPETAECQT